MRLVEETCTGMNHDPNEEELSLCVDFLTWFEIWTAKIKLITENGYSPFWPLSQGGGCQGSPAMLGMSFMQPYSLTGSRECGQWLSKPWPSLYLHTALLLRLGSS